MYKVAVEMTHTFEYVEEFEIEIEEAENDQDALAQAQELIKRESSPDYLEATLEDSALNSICVTDRPDDSPDYRCEETVDMFKEGN